MGSLGELLEHRASAAFVGRAEERAALLRLLEPGGPVLAFVHGIAGVGKTALIDAFARDARARGAAVVRIDCRTVEPTAGGFLGALSAAVGGAAGTPRAVARRLAGLGDCVVLVLDTYELLRLIDPWLRQDMIPQLPESVRVVVSGREPPAGAWLGSPAWSDAVFSLPLRGLAAREAVELLEAGGVDLERAARLNRLAHGHPLALRIALSAVRSGAGLDLERVASARVVEELTALYLDGLDGATRRALDAASVVRRVTLPLLGAMLPDVAPQDAFDRLRALPFVEQGPDGLVVHDAVREAAAAALQAADPVARRSYRAAAWRVLRAELRAASPRELWRSTADTLYLIEHPVVREAFFPSGGQACFVDVSAPADGPAVCAIAERHDTGAGAELVARWWSRAPERFRIVRGPAGVVAGFILVFDPQEVPHAWLEEDAVTRAWRDHLRRVPVVARQRVLFLRRFLAHEGGEAPSPAQAAAWLDVKRMYMELRPSLRRLYSTLVDPEPYGEALQELGFAPVPEADVEIGDRVFHTALLDFGPGSVDGWLSWLVESELRSEEPLFLDREQRQLVLDGRGIDLSRLEFGLLECLREREGAVVSREELLLHVWGTDYTGGSNVVEAVVRTLRRKLGEQAGMIETVRGAGYRFAGPSVA